MLRAEVPEELAGQRLDQALAQMFADYSRSRLKIWIDSNKVLVDGAVWRARDKVHGGEMVEVNADLEIAETAVAEDIPLDIIYQDDDLLVVNKPVGLVVHPGAGNWQGTLLNGLLYFDPKLGAVPRAGIVHRLDKDTSGLMVVARTLQAHHALVTQLQDKTVYREYHALVCGEVISGGTIDAPIARHPTERLRFAVRENGRDAVTHYRVLKKFKHYTLLKVMLETGRTHQIRVHMSHIGFPLLGDQQYRGRLALPKGASDELIDTIHGFKRQALHAAKLGLVHPGDLQERSWEVKLAPDFQQLIDVIQSESA